jgi:D-tyrosyl-tRNA(Tyr) deacylase
VTVLGSWCNSIEWHNHDSVRIVLQRVSRASVSVDGSNVSEIGRGLCLLVGIEDGDDARAVDSAVAKISGLRVFSDDAGKMNLSVADVGGEVLVVSQFTLLGDTRRGRRPSFTAAASPKTAQPLLDRMATTFRSAGIPTSEGVFGARMDVELVNDGPVTLLLEFGSDRRD